jgi:hypothetical protein
MIPVTTYVGSNFLTARAAARHMLTRHSGVIIFLTASGWDRAPLEVDRIFSLALSLK